MATQQAEKTRLGDILVNKGLINDFQLRSAIASQADSDLPLGQILIANKWVSQRQIDQALKVQSKLRNALVSSLISLSPLALVGCGTSAAPSDEAPVAIEQVDNSGSQSGSASQDGSDGGSSEEQGNDASTQENGSGGSANVVEGQSGSGDEGAESGSNDESASGEGSSNSGADQGNSETNEEESANEPVTLGAIEFNWTYPTQRADGSDFAVYEVDVFRIYQVSESGEVDTMHEVNGLDTNYIVTELASGEYHFAITVVDTDGLESDLSSTLSIAI